MSKIIQVSDETYKKIKNQLLEEEKVENLSDLIGKQFFFRTVTYHHVGRVVRFFGNFVVLENASWVADSGRFMQAIKEGTLSEVEPVGEAYVNLSSVVDFFLFNHDLPTKQK